MSIRAHKSPGTGRQSRFFRDLATPVSAHRGKFTSPGQAAAVTALWRENVGVADPPPPPIVTLEDRSELTPESGLGDCLVSSEIKLDTRTPSPDALSPLKWKSDASTSYHPTGGRRSQHSPARLSWWSPGKSVSPLKALENRQDQGVSSQADGVAQPDALITLPPPREVAKPNFRRNMLPTGDLDEETWVTVYGFSPGDTNLVLREFDKCGAIIRHIPGPGNANWVHILYQNRSDAERALRKNGLQINSVLIVGVKPLDPSQRQFLDEKVHTSSQGFMVLPPKPSGMSSLLTPSRSSRPYQLQATNDTNRRAVGTIASPAKSAISKIVDLMFGV